MLRLGRLAVHLVENNALLQDPNVVGLLLYLARHWRVAELAACSVRLWGCVLLGYLGANPLEVPMRVEYKLVAELVGCNI